MSDFKWYNVKTTLAKGCLFNFISGARGLGKTYSAKMLAVENFIEKGERFVYVRRYKSELTNIQTFFEPLIRNGEFEDHELSAKGHLFYIDGEMAGEVVCLSKAVTKKGTSLTNVRLFIFDEYLIEEGSLRYLKNEVVQFLELYESYARLNDVIVLFLSNAISFINPYFNFFNIKMPYKSEFYRNGDMLFHMVENEDYSAAKRETRIGKILQGTTYASYAYDNKFLLDNDTFIAKKTAKSEYFITLVGNGVKYGVWVDYNEGIMTVSLDIDKDYPAVYSLTKSDHNINTMLITGRKPPLFKRFLEMLTLGNVRFESIKVKGNIMEVLKHYV